MTTFPDPTMPTNSMNWHAPDTVPLPAVARITPGDLPAILRQGLRDFAANRTDVLFLCVLYPVLGLLMAQYALGANLLPVLFPLAVGFALVGPVAAVGLNEMSRRREHGDEPSWRAAFGVVRAPSFGGVVAFALMLGAIFVVWLATAQEIYRLTLGDTPPVSIGAFAHDVLLTPAGWALIVAGMGVGFGFALVVLAVSIVTFPMLIDRRVSLVTAIGTSLRVARTNPRAIAAWGVIVAGGLFLGSLPALLGLAFVLPILGHATWHLYRGVVPSE